MTSKETKKLIEEFADANGIDRKDMENMINYYYRDIVRIANNWEHPRISIYGLGTLEFKEYKFSEWRLGRKQYKKLYAQIKKDRQKQIDADERLKTGQVTQKAIFNRYYKLPKDQRTGKPPKIK